MKRFNKLLMIFFIVFCLSFGGTICLAAIVVPNNTDYMDFKNPVDLAVSEHYYIAAESNCLHIYDRQSGNYSVMNLSVSAEKVYINDRGIFILSDTKLYFCEFGATDFTTIIPKDDTFPITGNTFAVNGENLITATNNNIKSYTYIDGSYVFQKTLQIQGNTVPYLAFKNGGEYEYITGNISDIDTKAIAHDGTDLYFTGNSGFYKKSGDTVTKISDNANYTAIKYYGGKIYLTEKFSNYAKMTSYDTASGSFDNFEISSSSSSDNRINNAEDICGFNSNLLIADTLNKRVSVLEKDGNFVNKVNFDYYPYLICATKEKTLVVTSSSSSLTGDSLIYTVDLKNINSTLTPVRIDNALLNGKSFKAAAASDDFYYLLTENDGKYAELTIISLSGEITNIPFLNTLYPKKLTCDINGNLFVLFDDGRILKYSDNLSTLQNFNGGEQIAQFNVTQDILKFIIDIKQTPFIITADSKIYKSENGISEYAITPIYTSEKLKSFVYFCDDKNLYLLFTNTIVSDSSSGVKTLTSISVPTDYTLNVSTEILTIKAGRHLLLFDYTALEKSEFFPVTGYTELESDLNVIKLFETDEHIVFIGKYTGLVAKDSSNVFAYTGSFSTEKSFSGFLSGNANVYKYPVLNSAFTVSPLTKHTAVDIIELVYCEGLSTHFYKINCGDVTGYVPSGFIITTLIENTEYESFTVKNVEGDNIQLFSDNELSQKISDIKSGAEVKLYSNENGVALINIEIDGVAFTGYINSDFIKQKGDKTPRNVAIILIVVLSFTITSLYFLKAKKNKI